MKTRAEKILNKLSEERLPLPHEAEFGQYRRDSGYASDYYLPEPSPGDYAQTADRRPTRKELKELEIELRRENPDLLDELRFAMSDKSYGVLLKHLARGAFWAAAIYAQPYIVGPLIGLRAWLRHKDKRYKTSFSVYI
jgi:hypothetical protein